MAAIYHFSYRNIKSKMRSIHIFVISVNIFDTINVLVINGVRPTFPFILCQDQSTGFKDLALLGKICRESPEKGVFFVIANGNQCLRWGGGGGGISFS